MPEKKYTVCEYFSQGENDAQCEECGTRIDEYDRGYGTVFYSVGPESVRWSIGDGAIICPDCIGKDKYMAVKPL
jgi:ribosomal protein L34E